MSSVTFSTLRQRFADSMASITGFREVRNPFDGYGRSPNTMANKGFSIGIRNTTARDDTRQRDNVGVMLETEVFVKFAIRIAPKNQIASFDSGLDACDNVIQTLTHRHAPLHNDVSIRFTGFDNELTQSGEFVIFTLSFYVLHYIEIN